MRRPTLPAQSSSKTRLGPLVLWSTRHAQGALASLGRLARNRLATAMMVAVVGIALALPAALHVATVNLAALAASWRQTTDISLFLVHNADPARAQLLAERLEARRDIADVRLITPEDALAELSHHGGFAAAIDQLEHNPLPIVLAIRPAESIVDPASLEALANALSTLPDADFARLDTLWIRRFGAIIDLARRGALLLGVALALAVLIVVGNTIRLEIENRRDEIEIMELVGATSAFIRRPFLYVGAWYGLFGGLTAALLVNLSVVALQGPVSRLAGLYEAKLRLVGLAPLSILVLLAVGVLLGLLGSWVSVGRHLTAAEPD